MKKIIRGEESPGGGVKRYTQMILVDAPTSVTSSSSYGPDSIREELAEIDVNSLTPLAALTLLADLKRRAGEHP